MIIDAHVYCLPPRLRDQSVVLPAGEQMISRALFRHPEGGCALPLASPERILHSMEKSAISRSVLVSLPWRSAALCRENNEFVLAAARDNPRFMAVCSVQPRSREWGKESVRCLRAGAVGIKINPVWQGYCLDGPETGKLAELVAQKNAFLMVHVDHPFRKSDASAAHLFSLAESHPRTKILAAHLGGMLGVYALHPPVARVLANVWFDTAVSSTIPMVEFTAKAGLAEKIVFGSDFPFNHCHDQARVIKSIRSLKLGARTRENIFSRNFLSLLER